MADRLDEIENGELRLNFHPGPMRAWKSEKRFVFVLAGTQGGKTVFGPHWLKREIERHGDGDYLIVSSTYSLLGLKVLPETLRLFCEILRLGRFKASERMLFLDAPDWYQGRIIFGSADRPESLESVTAKAAWLDEAGQGQFKLGAWEAVRRRVGLHQGRILATTTIYNRGWIKSEVYDRWKAGDPGFDVIQFPSTANPAFPRQEFEQARSSLPAWKFNMFYRGVFDRPAGLIYDAFDDELCKIPPFKIPDHWPRYVGLDFGGVNTAAIFFAEDPVGKRYYAYREYLRRGRSIAEHARALADERVNKWIGGSASEEQWRREFRQAGIPVEAPPVTDVEVGINRVYACHRRSEIYVFDTLARYLDEKGSYCRKSDEQGEPTEEIEDKEQYHIMDAERYVVSWLCRSLPAGDIRDLNLSARKYETYGGY